MPAFLIMDFGQFIFSLKSGWWREKSKAIFWMKTPWHWPYLFKKHFRVKRLRKIKDREVLKNFIGRISYQEIDNWALKFVNPIFDLYFKIIRKIIFW